MMTAKSRRAAHCALALGFGSVVLLPGQIATAETKEKVLISGSSTTAPLVAELAKAYESKHPNVRIEVQTGGSSKGLADCRAELNDLGMISRDLTDKETDAKPMAIAQDGVAMVVHTQNPLTKLTREQVVKIYTGATTTWKDLGGVDKKIVVVNKAEGRGTLELFLHHFGLKSSQVKADVIIGEEEQGVKTLVGNEQSIGYLSVSTVETAIRNKLPLRLVTLEGQTPSSAE